MSEASAIKTIAIITGSREGARMKKELSDIKMELAFLGGGSDGPKLRQRKELLEDSIKLLARQLIKLGVDIKE